MLAPQGGPSIFVLCWAVIKASTVEPDNLSVDGVSSSYLLLFGSIKQQFIQFILLGEWKQKKARLA